MNKKGFTLVELLGVLVIIALILIVVLTPIMGQIRSKQGEIDDATKRVLYSSATSYLDNYQSYYPKADGNIYYISLNRMINAGELSDDYLDDETLNANMVIKVTVENGGYQYSIIQNVNEEIVDSEPIYSNLDKVYKSLEEANDSYSYMKGNYLKGNITNNYLYFSGFLWRIMGQNQDGSIKLITDEVVSTVKYGTYNAGFEKTNMYVWLNDYFYPKLTNTDIIVKGSFCDSGTSITTPSDFCTNLLETSLLYSKVGLLNILEYNFTTDDDENNYLKNGTKFSLLTEYSDSAYQAWIVGVDGQLVSEATTNLHYIRPVINVEASTLVTAGTGSSSDPYILNKNVQSVVEADKRTLQMLNLTAGEYISFDNKVYRVIENDKKEVKVILNNYYSTSNTYSFSVNSTSAFSPSKDLGYTLNTTIYNSYSANAKKLLLRTYIYQGDKLTSSDTSHKTTSLSKSNMVTGVTISLPKVSEILSAPIPNNGSKTFWTLTKYNNSSVYTISNTETTYTSSTYARYLRPVIRIDAGAFVSSGNGTKASPYVVKLS